MPELTEEQIIKEIEKFNKKIEQYDPKEAKKVFEDTINAMLAEVSEYSNNYMFYGYLIAQCKRNFDITMQAPAAVSFEHDKYILHINPLFFNDYSITQRLAVLKHEMLHILNGHLSRLEEREMLGWNYATDCAINQQIVREHLPEGCIYPDNYPAKEGTEVPTNKSAEIYYSLLENPKNPNNEEQQDCPQCQGSGESEESDENGNKKPCPHCGGSGKQSNNVMDDHSKWQDSKGDSDLQKDLTKKMIESAVSNTEKSRGSLPSQLSDFLELHSRKNEVDWRKVLRNVVGNKRANVKRTLMRRDRRFLNRPDIKGRKKDRVFNLLVIADVSGSVSDSALLKLLGEIQHICKLTNTEVDLIQVDTTPAEPEKLDKNTKIIERKACGGTLMYPGIEKADEYKLDYNAVVVSTDGWLDSSDVEKFNNLQKRIIWLIEPEGRIMDNMQQGMMQAFQLKD